MNPENVAGAPATAPAPAAPVGQEQKKPDSFVQFADRPEFNIALLIAWLAALVAILATLYFWWIGKIQTDQLTTAKSARDDLVAQLSQKKMVETEKTANEFKQSVKALTDAKSQRLSMTDLLPELYSKITEDTKLSSFNLSNEGALSLAGTTTTYRSAADLTMALKSWEKLKEVDLASVSYLEATTDASASVQFSISAKLVTVPGTTTATTADSSTTQGGI